MPERRRRPRRKRAKLDVDELKSLGELVSRLIAMRAQLLRLRDVQRSAARAPAAPESDAERDERLHQIVCEMLDQPSHPSGKRARLKARSGRRAGSLGDPGSN